MSITPQLIPIEINNEKKRQIVLTNIVKMLSSRNVLNQANLYDNIKKILSIQSDDLIYEIVLDNPTIYYSESTETKKLYIKILNQKITGIPKTSNIGDFLHSHKNHPKIIVVASISNKAREQIINEFKYSEVFMEKDLMIDKISHVSVPKHELLTDADAKLVLEEYSAKKREIPKMYVSDPIARYYNAKIGNMFRIIRPSEISGLVTTYRFIIKGSMISP